GNESWKTTASMTEREDRRDRQQCSGRRFHYRVGGGAEADRPPPPEAKPGRPAEKRERIDQRLGVQTANAARNGAAQGAPAAGRGAGLFGRRHSQRDLQPRFLARA